MIMTRMMVNMVRRQTVRCTPKVVRTPQAANDDDDDNDDDEEKDDGEYGEQANWLVQCTLLRASVFLKRHHTFPRQRLELAAAQFTYRASPEYGFS